MHITYRPGGWFGIVGEHLLVALPPGQKRKAIAVWEIVDEGAAFDQVLDVIISSGLRDLPGLVMIGVSDDTTRVLVRGSAQASFDTSHGPVTVDGQAAWTWQERTLAGVTTMAVLLEDAALGEPVETQPLLVDRGLVRLGALSRPAAAPAVSEPPSLEPADTQATPVIGDDLLTEPVVAAPRPSSGRLVLSTGDEVEVDRPLLIGRAPEARRFFSGDEPRLITVPSPQHEISSTHLEIRPGDDGQPVVTDLGSTNGTVLVQPGLAPEDLRPGYPVTLSHGAIIDLGDGVTIKVA